MTLDRDPLNLTRVLDQLGRGARAFGDDVEIAVPLDRESYDRLTRDLDAIGHPVGPRGLDTHDHDGGDVGIRPGADQGAKGELQVLSELETTVRVRDRQSVADQSTDTFDRGIRQVVDGQDDHVITNTHAPVGAPITS